MRTSAFDCFDAADALEFFSSRKAQEFRLDRQRHFADFVEEERAAARGFRLAFLVANRAGERTFHVAVEFAFQQRLGQRGAVERDERAARAC